MRFEDDNPRPSFEGLNASRTLSAKQTQTSTDAVLVQTVAGAGRFRENDTNSPPR